MLKIDLHGQDKIEAKINMEIFLKECKLKKVKNAMITHGNGKFILRNCVVEILQTKSYVESYTFAPPVLGGTGVTVVTFNYQEIKNIKGR
ncbi:MAG: Smr/MutS family protein [Mycoplasmatales bacterium]